MLSNDLFLSSGGYVEMSAQNSQINPSTSDDYVNMNSSRGDNKQKTLTLVESNIFSDDYVNMNSSRGNNKQKTLTFVESNIFVS